MNTDDPMDDTDPPETTDAALPADMSTLQPDDVDTDQDVTAEPDVESAFAQVQPVVFDNELPWTVDTGRVLNRFGVCIARFENWEQADAVVAMMNATQALIEAATAINAASLPPAPPAPAAPLGGLAFEGIPIKVDPMLDGSLMFTNKQMREAAEDMRQAYQRNRDIEIRRAGTPFTGLTSYNSP